MSRVTFAISRPPTRPHEAYGAAPRSSVSPAPKIVADVPDNVAATLDYRRRARRLRSMLASDPGRLQRALADLARQQTATAGSKAVARAFRVDVMAVPPPAAAAAAAERFGRIVREQVDGPIVPFARRQSMLRAAGRLGIGRFPANLVIAAEQYRHVGTKRGRGVVREREPARAWIVALAVFLAEACVVTTAWWTVGAN